MSVAKIGRGKELVPDPSRINCNVTNDETMGWEGTWHPYHGNINHNMTNYSGLEGHMASGSCSPVIWRHVIDGRVKARGVMSN